MRAAMAPAIYLPSFIEHTVIAPAHALQMLLRSAPAAGGKGGKHVRQVEQSQVNSSEMFCGSRLRLMSQRDDYARVPSSDCAAGNTTAKLAPPPLRFVTKIAPL